MKDSASTPRAVLIATGSEVALAIAAQEILEARGIPVRVVSAPCLEWFNEESQSYRDSVLPASIPVRISIEAGVAQGWREYVGDLGSSISLEHFGASASAKVLFREFGFTAEKVADEVIARLK